MSAVPKSQSAKKQFLINLAGMAVPIALVLISTPLYINVIGAERYGLLAIVWLLLSYLAFMDFGFGRAMNNQLAKLPTTDLAQRGRMFWSAIVVSSIVGTVAGLGCWFLGNWLLPKYVADIALQTELLVAMPWLALGLPVILMTLICTGALEGCQRFGWSNMLQSLASSLYQFIPLYLAWKIAPELGLIIKAGVIVRLAMLLGYFYAVFKHCSLKLVPAFGVSQVKIMLGYGGWVALTGIISPLLEMADRLMIQALRGAVPVAYYTVAYNLIRAVRIVPLGLSKTVFPRFSKSDDNDLLSQQSFIALLYIMTPLLACGIVGVEPFIRLWINPEFAQAAAPVAEIMLLGTWLNALAFVPYSKLQGEGRPGVVARLHLMEVIPYLIVLYIAVQQFGIIGAAAAWSLRLAIDCLLLFRASGQLVMLKTILPAGLLMSVALALLFIESNLLLRAGCCVLILSLWGSYLWQQRHNLRQL